MYVHTYSVFGELAVVAVKLTVKKFETLWSGVKTYGLNQQCMPY